MAMAVPSVPFTESGGCPNELGQLTTGPAERAEPAASHAAARATVGAV